MAIDVNQIMAEVAAEAGASNAPAAATPAAAAEPTQASAESTAAATAEPAKPAITPPALPAPARKQAPPSAAEAEAKLRADREMDGMRKEIEQLRAEAEFARRVKADPYATLPEVGFDLTEANKRAISHELPREAMIREAAELKALRAELAELKNGYSGLSDAEKQRQEAAERASMEQSRAAWVEQGKAFVDADPRFELNKAVGAYDALLAEAAQHYERTGEHPTSYEPLALAVSANVERTLRQIAELARTSEKARQLLSDVLNQTPAATPEPSEATGQQRATPPQSRNGARPALTSRAAAAASSTREAPARKAPPWGNPHVAREERIDRASR